MVKVTKSIVGLNTKDSTFKTLSKSINHATVVYLGNQNIEESEIANKEILKFSDLKERIRKNYNVFQRKSRICQNPNEDEKVACDSICRQIHWCFHDAFLKLLGRTPPLNKEGVDLAKIKFELVDRIAAEDISFLRIFLDTQMFVSYVERSIQS